MIPVNKHNESQSHDEVEVTWNWIYFFTVADV